MPTDHFTADESRKLAVLIARSWADAQLANEYKRNPEAVLAGAGINLGSRTVPDIPEKPAELAAHKLVSSVSSAPSSSVVATSSASSLSTITCPCTGCTASCASCAGATENPLPVPDPNALLQLADSPEARADARKLTAAWKIDLKIGR